MRLVTLDTDVLAELSGPENKSESLRKWLEVRKQRGDLIVVVPQVIAESEQASVRPESFARSRDENVCHDSSLLNSLRTLPSGGDSRFSP